MKNSLSPSQYAVTSIILMSVFKLSALPGMLAASSGRDIWISVSVMLAGEILTLAFIVPVSVRGGLKVVSEKYGNFVYSLIAVPVIAVSVIKILVYVADVNAFTSSYLFYNISTDKVGIVFVIAAAYIATKGFKGIGRSALVAVWFIPLILIIGLLFGIADLDFARLRPVAASDAEHLFRSLDSSMFWGFDLSPLMFCSLKESAERSETATKKIYISVFAAVTAASAVIAFVYAAYIAVYGGATYISPHAFAALGSFNVVNTEIGSIDWPAVVTWLAFAVLMISFSFAAVGEGAKTYGIKAPIAISVAAVAVCVIGPLFFYNFEKAVEFAKTPIKYVVFGINILLPPAAFILVMRKSARGQRRAYEARV